MSLAVPPWASQLRAEGWANIHDILTPPRLSGVDSWLGDTNAETLLLAKDCAPASEFRKRLAVGDPDPYRHDPKLPTNRNLHALLSHVGVDAPLDGTRARQCGVYYANAFYLLRDDDKFSGSLPNVEAARAQSARILNYLFASLPRLRRVIALGADSYAGLAKYFGLEVSWRANLNDRRIIKLNGLQIIASSHTGSRGMGNRLIGRPREENVRAIQDDWKHAFEV